MNNKVKYLVLIILILSLAVIASGCSLNSTFASINGQEISYRDYSTNLEQVKANYEDQQPGIFESEDGEAILQLLEEQVYQYMISEALVVQQAKQLGVYPTNEEIENELEKIKANYASEEEFEQALSDSKSSLKDLRDYMAFELASSKLMTELSKDITVTDQEAEEYFNEYKSDFGDDSIKFEDVKEEAKKQALNNKQINTFYSYMNEAAANAIIKYNGSYGISF